MAKITTAPFVHTSRRDLLAWAVASLAPLSAATRETRQASGIKVGEITARSARIWTRRTRESARFDAGAAPLRGIAGRPPVRVVDPLTLQGACPGAEGFLRVLAKDARGRKVFDSKWSPALEAHDFTHQFVIDGLNPATAYRVTVETKSAANARIDGTLDATFRTAPAEDQPLPVSLAMMSCQKYSERDDDRGFLIYDAIRAWAPNFYLSVGDNVYYDSDDPVVNSIAVARHHWHRMFSLGRIADCNRAVPGYWLKDDHDCYADDCYPGHVNERMAPFTFAQGLPIFPEQVPLGDKPYRRFRWGRGLEVWMLEGRDYRTPNPSPDGPSKSIWGPEQKKWLMESLTASTAQWKLIVSPTPLVGPDRPTKKDNHANETYRTEGREFRKWLSETVANNTVVLCGDRHWQYHSIDPETKVEEFGCGAASDSHAAGTPGENKAIHQFHRVKGGFLAISVDPTGARSRLNIEHRDSRGMRVHGKEFIRAI